MLYVLRTYSIGNNMKLIKALSLSIAGLEQPVITFYQLGVIVHQIYQTKTFRGENISSIKKELADYSALTNALGNLVDDGILDPFKGFPSKSVFSILGKTYESPTELACVVDPFCYVSHLSAMDHHGLTNRMPSTLFLSSPGREMWRRYADERMHKDLGDDLSVYRMNGLPELHKIRMEKIGRVMVHKHNSLHLGAYKNVRGKNIRVASIGRTFLDMLRNPDLCGGIRHVLDVYEEYAEIYLKLIVDEVTQHGRPIDKVRAGYILDERLGLSHPLISEWLSLVQRGGSRKLDASAEYIPEFSEKWCLSINV